MNRLEIQREFVRLFAVQGLKRPEKISSPDLERWQEKLSARLPASFKQFALEFGTIWTPKILEFINGLDADHPDVQDFYAPEPWMFVETGLPNDLFPFAGDCMGNIFCFKRNDKESDDTPVWFFDHDFNETSQVAESFDKFLLWYIRELGPVVKKN